MSPARPPPPADNSRTTKHVAGPQLRQGNRAPAVLARDLDGAAADDEARVALVAFAEHNLPRVVGARHSDLREFVEFRRAESGEHWCPFQEPGGLVLRRHAP